MANLTPAHRELIRLLARRMVDDTIACIDQLPQNKKPSKIREHNATSRNLRPVQH